MAQSMWKTVWQLLKRVNIELPYDPGISLLCMPTRNENVYPPQNLHMNVYNTIIHKTQTVEKPSVHQQMNGETKHGISI